MSSNDINKNMGNFFFSLHAVIFAVFIEITSSTVYFGLRQCDYIKAIRFIYVALPIFFSSVCSLSLQQSFLLQLM